MTMKTLTSQSWYISVLLIFYPIGSTAQVMRMIFEPKSTVCTNGLMENVDRVVITGDLDLQGSKTQHWQIIITFRSKRNMVTNHPPFCTIDDSSCDAPTTNPCDCKKRINGFYIFIINRTATTDISQTELHARCDTNNYVNAAETYLKMPVIYGKQDLNDTLQIGDSVLELFDTPNCSFELKEEQSTNMEFCIGGGSNSNLQVHISLNDKELISSTSRCTVIIQRHVGGVFGFHYTKDAGCLSRKKYTCNVTRPGADALDLGSIYRVHILVLVVAAMGGLSFTAFMCSLAALFVISMGTEEEGIPAEDDYSLSLGSSSDGKYGSPVDPKLRLQSFQ